MKITTHITEENNRYYLTVPYSDELNGVYKTIPGYFWHAKEKRWSFPAVPENLSILKSVLPWLSITGNDGPMRPDNTKLKPPAPSSYKGFTFKTKPYRHQLIAWDRLRNSDGRHGLLMEMGTGKTKVVIDWLAWRVYTKENPGIVLFIAPNSLLEKEVDEFAKHWDMSNAYYFAQVLRGSKERKKRIIEAMRHIDGCRVLIAGYETVRTLEKELLELRPETIILDESTRCKNARAQQSKTIHKLGALAKYRVIMTGTPITQSPVDIYSQYKFLRPQIFGTSFLAFRARYCVMGGFQQRQIMAYNNLGDLSAKVFSCATRFTKDECLDLPDKIRKVYRYDLSTEQRKTYDELKTDLCTEIQGKTVIAAHVLTRMLRFQQIASGFLDIEGKKTIFKENPKLALLQDIIEENKIDKCIIWCRYLHEISLLENYFTGEGWQTYCLQGSVDGKDRLPMIQKFNSDKTKAVFIGQIRTGGLGIDLVGCDKVFYFSNSWSLEDRLQSEDRTHRIGQTRKVLYFDLIGKNTIEETVHKCLSAKQNLADIINCERSLKIVLEGGEKSE